MVLSLFLGGSAIALLILTRCYLKCSPPASLALASVVSLAWDDMTYSTGRVLDVVLATRDQMHVAVEYSLPGSFAVVHADVESLHARVHLLDHLLLLF